MKQNKNVSTGLTYGVIIGLVYCLLLFWRWSTTSSMIMFGLTAILGYMVILGFLFYEASYRKKQDEGFITFKNLFQTLFISVLIFELFYSIYNFVHLKYIDPAAVDKLKAGMQAMLDKAGDRMTDQDKQESLARLDKLNDATQIGQIIKSYFVSIAISGVFAVIIAAIMQKKKPVFEENN